MTNHLTDTQPQQNRPTIAFFNTDLGLEWALWPWQGMVNAADKYDVNLLTFVGNIINWPVNFEEQANILYDLANGGRLDGLIIWKGGLVMALTEPEIEAFCNQYGVPVVTLEGEVRGWPSVVYGNYQGMRAAVEHLIEAHGYRRIGFVGMHKHHIGFQERYRAYTDALTAHDLPIETKLAKPWFPDDVLLPPDGHVVEEVLISWLQEALTAGVEALVGVNDTSTIQVLKVLQALGVSVPGEVALVSFDDFIESRVVTPPLTTVMPSWHEFGYKAVEILVGMLKGQPAPEQVVVSPRLKIRQSCGCRDAYVAAVTAKPDHTPAPNTSLNLPETATELVAAAQASELESTQDELQSLLETFTAELTETKAGIFLDTLEQALQRSTATVDKLSRWHNIISTMRQQVLPRLNHNGMEIQQAETLLQQAQVLISRVAERTQISRSFRAGQKEDNLRELGLSLITTLNVDALMDTLADGLPGLGIPSCYLSLFENPQPYRYPDPAPEWSRLVLAYDPQGRAQLEPGGHRFPSRQLIPNELWPQDRACSFVLIPLHFQKEQMGFVLFESGSRNGRMYETLGTQISSALQGALLVQRVQENAAGIARQKYILDTFMENVPDLIYFKDRHSRIIQVNRAFVHRLGIAQPSDVVGKTDFDFFADDIARPKYEQEQEIIRTGRPVLALEEPDTKDHWALTTKMPLRDENNNIIGTFGISRDITELKRAQQAVELANKEIGALNEQLKEENLRMSAELDIARRLQEMILPPSEELQQIEGLDIVGYMRPADEVGGDYYDILQKNGVVHIGIGDVTGHGLESGVLMLMTQTAIRTLIDHGETDPVKFVTTLNRTIYGNVRRTNMDRILTFALINCEDGQLKIVGQHEELLVVRKDGQVERMDTLELGFPLGLEEEIAQWVDQAMVTLAPGEGIVLYTDGITEAGNMSQEFYGLERLCEVISQNWDASAEAVKQAVVEDVTRHIGQQKVYDDLTLVVLKRK